MHERLLCTHRWPRGCQVYKDGLSHLFQSRMLEEASDSSRHRKNCRSDVKSVFSSEEEDLANAATMDMGELVDPSSLCSSSMSLNY
jgi:hypothetical protein